MSQVPQPGAHGGGTAGHGERIESWKEIAAYLRRDLRTVMRWEHSRALPIHRLPGEARSPVFALKAEIDDWLARVPSATLDEADSTSSAGPGVAPATATALPSIAVLPFLNLAGAGENEFLADGIADEIIMALSLVPGLRVIARTSSFAFRGLDQDIRGIGAALGVATVLEGSLQRSGDRLRVTLQLINAADGSHLWSSRFDRTADDVFALQDEISSAVVRELEVRQRLSESGRLERRYVPAKDAYLHYLQGRDAVRHRDVQRAIGCFEHVTAADPGFALPHLGIAEAFFVMGLWCMVPSRAAFDRVKTAACRALELDDSLAGAHALLAVGRLLGDWDWQGAQQHFEWAQRALTISGRRGPTQYRFLLSFYHQALGLRDEALRNADILIEEDPLSAPAHGQAAVIHVAMGDFEAAVRLFETALELDEALPTTMYWLGACRMYQQRFEEAAELLGRANEHGLLAANTLLPAALLALGRREEALVKIEALDAMSATKYVPSAFKALAWAGLDERERCMALLTDEAIERERPTFLTMGMLCPGYALAYPRWLQEWIKAQRHRILPGPSPFAGPPDRA